MKCFVLRINSLWKYGPSQHADAEQSSIRIWLDKSRSKARMYFRAVWGVSIKHNPQLKIMKLNMPYKNVVSQKKC